MDPSSDYPDHHRRQGVLRVVLWVVLVTLVTVDTYLIGLGFGWWGE